MGGRGCYLGIWEGTRASRNQKWCLKAACDNCLNILCPLTELWMARAILLPAFTFDRQETDEFEFVAAHKLMCVDSQFSYFDPHDVPFASQSDFG